MKKQTFYNIRVATATTEAKALGKLLDEKFDTKNPLCDTMLTESQLLDKLPKFPNGFVSWMETHHEMVIALVIIEGDFDKAPQAFVDYYEKVGTGGMYELADRLTDQFEKENVGVVWGEDKEYFDTIEYFIDTELEKLS
jgi:hypothetical protein